MKQPLLSAIVLCLFVSIGFGAARRTPEELGAKGDGIADDTRFIQQCIDEIAGMPADADGSRGVVVLDKTYYVTRQVPVYDDTSPEHKLEVGPHHRVFHVPSGVTLTGKGTVSLLQGGQSARDNPTGYTYLFWVSQSPDRVLPGGRQPAEEDRVRDVTIQGISLVNDPASLYPPYSETSAIMVKYGRNIRVEDVRFRHWHRAVAHTRPIDSSVTGCIIEDTRYIGIALYGALAAGDERCRIAGNKLVGNTQLSGGIYVGGVNVDVADNQLSFTHGIFAESLSASTITGNYISRSPYGIRAGYLAGGAATDLKITGNTLEGCVSGIMLGNAFGSIVEGNAVRQFIKPGSDIMIEPPNGYWGFGREPAGINVEDSKNIIVRDNSISDLNEGVPIGIRVANSRFTIDYDNGCYNVKIPTSHAAPESNDGNQVVGNRIDATSGLRISCYVENQSNCIVKENESTNDAGGRVIASTGTFEPNSFSSPLMVVKDATARCRRLLTSGHPMHWAGMPAGACAFSMPAPAQNEYFPPLSAKKDK